MTTHQHNQSGTDATQLTAIHQDDLDDAAYFLHQHMNNQFAPEVWKQGISRLWLSDVPNYGFMLKHGTQIVGVLCALYSEQKIDGNVQRFCNPHSWCVLPDFRKRSIELVLAVIRQKDYTFTMFSPNKEGREIFSYLKFKPLDNRVFILLNLPALISAGSIADFHDSQQINASLPEQATRHYQDHADFPWLNFLFFHQKDRYGFLIFKKQRYKKLGCARIIYVSDSALFHTCWSAIGANLLFKHGLFTSKIEARLLDNPMKTWLKPEQGTQKYYLSDMLSANEIINIYSELVTLDI